MEILQQIKLGLKYIYQGGVLNQYLRSTEWLRDQNPDPLYSRYRLLYFWNKNKIYLADQINHARNTLLTHSTNLYGL